jgi:hypothetical protein
MSQFLNDIGEGPIPKTLEEAVRKTCEEAYFVIKSRQGGRGIERLYLTSMDYLQMHGVVLSGPPMELYVALKYAIRE